MPIVKQITKEMIDAIKVERQQVAKEIDRLFDKLAALEATLETYGVKALRPRAKRPPVAIAHSTNATDTAQYQGLTQIEAAYRLLVELGRPLHVDNIAFGLIQRGVKLRGDISNLSEDAKIKRLKQSLVRGLLRDQRFKNLGKNVFTLVENQGSGEVQESFDPYDPTGTPYAGPREVLRRVRAFTRVPIEARQGSPPHLQSEGEDTASRRPFGTQKVPLDLRSAEDDPE